MITKCDQAVFDQVLLAGEMLSNCAFNMAQDSTLPETYRVSLDESRKQWDAVVAKFHEHLKMRQPRRSDRYSRKEGKL